MLPNSLDGGFVQDPMTGALHDLDLTGKASGEHFDSQPGRAFPTSFACETRVMRARVAQVIGLGLGHCLARGSGGDRWWSNWG